MAKLKNGNKQAEGGRRSNAGRKPKAVTILKRRIIENRVNEADASFAFLCDVRDNNEEPTALRVEAAKMVFEIVCGKPKQAIDASLNAKVDLNSIDIIVHGDDSPTT